MASRIEALKDWYSALPERFKFQLLLLPCLVFWNEVVWLLITIVLCWHYREFLKMVVQGSFENANRLMIVLPIMLFFSTAFFAPPSAHDDLLRNIVAWRYDYDYRKMYPDAEVYAWSLWYGFDHLLGFLGHYLEPRWVMWLDQGIAASTMLAVLYMAGHRLLENREDKIFWIATGVWLAFSLCLSRIGGGRPEIFMAIWTAAAVIPCRRAGILLWIACGLALSSGYWLAFIYFPSLILLHTSPRKKTVIGIVLLSFHLLFWHWASGGEYFDSLIWLKRTLTNHVTEEQVITGESATILNAFWQPAFWLLFFVALYGMLSAPRKPWPLVAMLGYFFLPNQIRYLGTIAPLLAILAWTAWAERLPTIAFAGRGLLFGTMFIAMYFSLPIFHAGGNVLPSFKVPDGAKVLTGFGVATYSVVFHNPGTVQAAPAFALGASPKEIQHLALGIHLGSMDCAAVKQWHYSHVIENTLTGQTPNCLDLLATQQGWRLWQVRK